MGKQVAVPALLLTVFLVFGAATALARSVETPALSGKWTTTDPPINLSHIELGEINHRGEAVGYHHRPNGLDPPGARMVRIVQPPDASGVYRAKVALCDPATGAWIEKKAPSTFYPDAMAPDDVVEAVLTAFHRAEAGSNGHFVGSSGRGFAIEGWYQNGPDKRGIPASEPVMATSGLVSASRHPAGFLEASARPRTGRRGEVLAGFLQSDVQADLETARAYLDEIAAAARGETPRPGGTGNAFWVAIRPTGAVIRNIILEGAAPERYSLAELRAALEIWIEEIERARPGPNTPVTDGPSDKPGSPRDRRR